MPDISWQRAAMRSPWKVTVVLAFVLLGAIYTLYPFNTWSPGSSIVSDSPSSSSASCQIPSSPSGAKYTAVMIETNLDPHVVPIILHFASVLAPWWTLILYTLEENWKMPPSAPFRRAVETGKLSVKFLPADTKLSSSGAVSRFLAKPWLWEQLAWAERILMFQADSILCAGAEMTVDDFVEYDLVGAPIDPHYGHGYNGGLSIRNPSLFARITRETDFEKSGDEFEDQWFYKEAKARADKGQGVRLPEVDVAKQFAVETINYPRPLGYHQPARWRKDQMKEIEAWCPEVRMLLGRRAL